MKSTDPEHWLIIYGGESQQSRSIGSVMSWKKAGDLINKLEKSNL